MDLPFANLPERDKLAVCYRVVRPPAGGALLCRVLGEPVGLYTHWQTAPPGSGARSRSVPCLADLGGCPECRRGHKRHWTGYLPAMVRTQNARGEETWGVCAVTLPENAARVLAAAGPARGIVAEVKRGPHRNSPVQVFTQQGRWAGALPLAPDLGPTLLRMFGSAWHRAVEVEQLRERAPDDDQGEPAGPDIEFGECRCGEDGAYRFEDGLGDVPT